MQCGRCGFSNPEGMKFCGLCATALDCICPHCHSVNPANFAFCGQCASRLPRISHHTKPPRQIADEAERRQLTIMFCDIVNSSSISSKIDPEDLREIIKNYRSTCADVVNRHGGHIAQHLGDGILVYFGHPVSSEYDARRAVRCGIEIIKHIKRISYFPDNFDQTHLSVRIGIHTGLVVIGEIGNDKRAIALGETPNIASRIQDQAEPDSILISENTQVLLKNEFDTTLFKRIYLKGFSSKFNLFQVLSSGESQKISGISARTLSHLPLIGRESESRLLMEKIANARNGDSQFIFLCGEAGLGKTRLVDFVINHIRQDSAIFLECSGSSYYQSSFFHPVVEMVKRILGFNASIYGSENFELLNAAIKKHICASDIVLTSIAELLSIKTPQHIHFEDKYTPQQKKQAIIDTVIELITSLSEQQFVVLAAEDLQLVDPSTIEFLTKLSVSPGIRNVFSIYSFRSTFKIALPPQKNITSIKLDHFTHKQSGEMINVLCNYKYLPEDIFSEIIDKTDGIPFYIEEFTNAILRSKSLHEVDDRYILTNPMDKIGIPSTLHDSLMSRIDSLGEDRELAQICSILGREFSYELLCAISPYNIYSLKAGLNRLIKSEFFFQNSEPPGSKYNFRHALLHETAYQSLLIQTRRKYHQLVAALIKKRFHHIINETPEIMAHHCTEADRVSESLEYWFIAGQRAANQSANIEAITHFKNGLSALRKLSDSQDKMRWELKYQTSLGTAISCCKGYADPDVENAYARAIELCNNIEDIEAVFPVLCGLWEFYIVRANHQAASDLAKKLMEIAEDIQITQFLTEAHRINGTTHFWRGQLKKALFHFDSISSLDINRETITLPSDYCQDTRVATLANSSCALWLTGKPDQALDRAKAALKMAKTIAHPFSRAYALQFLATVHQLRGNRTDTAKIAETLIIVSKTYKFPYWEATGKMMQSWANSDYENINQNIQQFQDAMHSYNKSGNKLAYSYFCSLFIDLLKISGNLSGAIDITDKTLEQITSSNEKYFYAELLRIKGEILLLEGGKTSTLEAEDCLIKALDISNSQFAKSLALRTLISLSEFTEITGFTTITSKEISDKLNTLLEEIGEGSDTIDITNAKANYKKLQH